LIVPGARYSVAPISAVVLPAAASRRISFSRGTNLISPGTGRTGSQERPAATA
jgi:hypothetical protein